MRHEDMATTRLVELFVVGIRERRIGGIGEFLLHDFLLFGIDGELWWRERRHLSEHEASITDELARCTMNE